MHVSKETIAKDATDLSTESEKPSSEARHEVTQPKVKEEAKPLDEEKIIAKDNASEKEVKTDEAEEDEEIFRLHDNLPEPNIVVKGTIDLDSINDRTRPQRKSRTQKRKERQARGQKNIDNKKLKDEKVKSLKKEAIEEQKRQRSEGGKEGIEEGSRKKRRRRIRSSKVNIDKSDNYNQGSRRSRRSSLRKPAKAEVSEEDVQKQIKETLARLTAKRSKKTGAKYRRENELLALITTKKSNKKRKAHNTVNGICYCK